MFRDCRPFISQKGTRRLFISLCYDIAIMFFNWNFFEGERCDQRAFCFSIYRVLFFLKNKTRFSPEELFFSDIENVLYIDILFHLSKSIDFNCKKYAYKPYAVLE